MTTIRNPIVSSRNCGHFVHHNNIGAMKGSDSDPITAPLDLGSSSKLPYTLRQSSDVGKSPCRPLTKA